MPGPPATGPRRRVTDHVHPEYWTEADHDKFEARMDRHLEGVQTEVKGLREDVHGLATRFAWLMGALVVVVFVANLLSIFVLRWVLPPN
jgi:F0F1-type ATP synthase membrane subunit a